jgi:sec-independent protein translocase protein TatC
MIGNFLTKEPAIPYPNQIKMIIDDEMALSEHIEEFSQRLIFCLIFLLFATILCFVDVKEIVRIFQAPAVGVKFLQFTPGEYFFRFRKDCNFLWNFN